ncbi:unnamed protein product [Acanthoscelides obtectus]|uniref:Endonuclease/exonuclease/phosphatase domain-containing protein n=1 Tax=Acanthoscelides obtectus TaxID=200917 RepID=A0A9P0PL77_ACAOB|nr:unnamed protein product [Acanthoscelides obtectus]CAK1626287.1 hypothetical protein AOBTE_LOCUS3752 [Acanthoscelides obtectus]
MTRRKKKDEKEQQEDKDESYLSKNNANTTIEQEVQYLKKLLETKNEIILDKKRYINQLVNENRRLQEHYELIISSIVDKETIITSLGKINERVEKIEATTSYTRCNDVIKSYSGAVKESKKSRDEKIVDKINNTQKLMIKSTDKSNSNVLEDLKKSIDPAKSNICVNSVRKVNNGIILSCENEASMSKLMASIQGELGANFTVNEIKKYRPRMVINNVECAYTKSEGLIEKILSQNEFGIFSSDDIKTVTTFRCSESTLNVVIEVQLPKQKIAIGIFYRPPHSSVTEAGNTFDNMLPAILAEYDDIILAGDINVNLLLVCNNLTKCLDSYNLKQVISEPTRITESTLTLLDPIYLSKPESYLRSGTINADMITDHYLTFCDIRIALPKNQQKFVTFRDFHSLNEIAFEQDLKSFPWWHIISIDDIEDKINFLTDSILCLFNVHCPKR